MVPLFPVTTKRQPFLVLFSDPAFNISNKLWLCGCVLPNGQVARYLLFEELKQLFLALKNHFAVCFLGHPESRIASGSQNLAGTGEIDVSPSLGVRPGAGGMFGTSLNHEITIRLDLVNGRPQVGFAISLELS